MKTTKKNNAISRLTQFATCTFGFGLSFAVAASAEIDFLDPQQYKLSGHVNISSDYHWRGISMSQRKPSVQGSLQMHHRSGLYTGIFAASTDIKNGASAETDYLLGYRHKLDQHTLILQFINIHYPGSRPEIKTSFSEYSVGYEGRSLLAHKDRLTAAIAFSPEYYNHSGNMWRFDAYYSYPLIHNFGIFTAVGSTKLEDKQAFQKVWGNPRKDQYYNWKLGLNSTNFGLFSELYYADNSTVNPNIASMRGPRVIFSVSKGF